MEKYILKISGELGFHKKQVENTIKLLDSGCTIPFISRYRKEATGSLNEIDIEKIQDLLKKLTELDKRREAIIKSIEEQGKLTGEIKKQIESAETISELEDIYLPYKPKKKTRAGIARERGLEPLAKIILEQKEPYPCDFAKEFINDEVITEEDALQGARDIVAEWISEDIEIRQKIRQLFFNKAVLSSKLVKSKKEEAIKYQDYFEYGELIKKAPSHRLLAVLRGAKEGLLRVSVLPPEEDALDIIYKKYLKSNKIDKSQILSAISDSYKRLIAPSIENETIQHFREIADKDAISVFAENLRQLLLAPPLGGKRILAIDPGYRTGCKIVCLDENGNLLMNDTIYPHPPQNEKTVAKKKIASTVNAYKIEAIAIGNGTAGRETEHFIKSIRFDREINVFVVNESGASVYSASKVGREEFPQFDVTVRGAVSIGRRLMDPLAELVKIDPKSIGVGQYQHDVNQTLLKESLDRVVESCVNLVGVNLNTASEHLLKYISGFGPVIAKNVIKYRTENGNFKNRKELLNVPKLGNKAFEQAAGFLRIPGGENILDNTAVHPERYGLVEKIAKDNGCTVKELINNKQLRDKINLDDYVTNEVGLPTLLDIMKELDKPGRDPRKQIKIFEFDKNVYKIEDLQEGMILPGIITNITNFGAFVDIGIKENGLIHISNLKNEFVSNPNDVVRLNQHVKVKILEVDIQRKRIQLSLKDVEQ